MPQGRRKQSKRALDAGGGSGAAKKGHSSPVTRKKPAKTSKRPRAAPASRQKRSQAADYDKVKARARARARSMATEGQEIGRIPPVADPERRAAARASFRTYCETYYPEVFYLDWSDDHLHVLHCIEQSVLESGLFALAMPRGGGKTSLCIIACEWAILNGHRRFVALVGADAKTAQDELLDAIKTHLETNDLLLADYPEVVYPIRCLERTPNRCKGQRCNGDHTRIEWKAEVIVLPSIPADVIEDLGVTGINGCGGIIKTAGLLGRVRGMLHTGPDGKAMRPDLVDVDDPQTDETARSATQCQSRIKILSGAILKLAGPDREISGFMPCTVIQPGDMADQILNQELHPEWRGERMRMVNKFPTNEKLWDEYAELYRQGLRARDVKRATSFYRKHRKAMDEGAEVAWPERHYDDELSGLQHAMNWRIKDEASFWAEFQNEPIPEEDLIEGSLDADQVMAKINNRPRGQVPAHCGTLTAFVDCGQKILFWAVCAWEDDFTGYVIDYGCYPDQGRLHFNTRSIARTLARIHQGTGVEGALYAGLRALVTELVTRDWKREDGAIMRLSQLFIDQNWKTDTVHQFCRESSHGAVLMPARGQPITASQKPINEYTRGRGDRIGHHWWVPSVKGKRVLRHVENDVNYWKTFIHDRLGTALGDKGCLSLFGNRPEIHRLLAEHVTAEYRVRTEGRGRTVDEWKDPPNHPDNHWFDCLVGCAAGASYLGVEMVGAPTATRKTGSINLREWQERGRRRAHQAAKGRR